MNDDQLPPILVQLEEELARRPTMSPPAELRQRILHAATLPLCRRATPTPFVEFLAATAAAVFLCANLSMSLATQTDYGLMPKFDWTSPDAIARVTAQLLPDAAAQEAFIQALRRQAGNDFMPAQAPYVNEDTDTRAWAFRLRHDS
jgi:hypothetical protein